MNMKTVTIKTTNKKLMYKNAIDPKKDALMRNLVFRKRNRIIYHLYDPYRELENEEWRDAY